MSHGRKGIGERKEHNESNASNGGQTLGIYPPPKDANHGKERFIYLGFPVAPRKLFGSWTATELDGI